MCVESILRRRVEIEFSKSQFFGDQKEQSAMNDQRHTLHKPSAARPRLNKGVLQRCATCRQDYGVLRREAHWRDLCRDCYIAKMDATRMAAAKPPLAVWPQQSPTPKYASVDAYDLALQKLRVRLATELTAPTPLPIVALGTSVRRAHEQARSDLILQASQPVTSPAGKVAYARLLRIAQDQRRLWQQRLAKPDPRRLRRANDSDGD
jgi:hypothetical protein